MHPSNIILLCYQFRRKMSSSNSVEEETECPFTSQSTQKAYGPEVSLFLHCHLRGYDETGEGISAHHGNYHAY